MKKLGILATITLCSAATAFAADSVTPSPAEVKSSETVSTTSEKNDLEWEVYWDKDVRSYFVRFYNNTSRSCDVFYEIWNGRKWIDGAGFVRPYKTASWSAGDYGKIRNVEVEWK